MPSALFVFVNFFGCILSLTRDQTWNSLHGERRVTPLNYQGRPAAFVTSRNGTLEVLSAYSEHDVVPSPLPVDTSLGSLGRCLHGASVCFPMPAVLWLPGSECRSSDTAECLLSGLTKVTFPAISLLPLPWPVSLSEVLDREAGLSCASSGAEAQGGNPPHWGSSLSSPDAVSLQGLPATTPPSPPALG